MEYTSRSLLWPTNMYIPYYIIYITQDVAKQPMYVIPNTERYTYIKTFFAASKYRWPDGGGSLRTLTTLLNTEAASIRVSWQLSETVHRNRIIDGACLHWFRMWIRPCHWLRSERAGPASAVGGTVKWYPCGTLQPCPVAAQPIW